MRFSGTHEPDELKKIIPSIAGREEIIREQFARKNPVILDNNAVVPFSNPRKPSKTTCLTGRNNSPLNEKHLKNKDISSL
jgi:hypothetical protein